jgi:hypothetical protein
VGFSRPAPLRKEKRGYEQYEVQTRIDSRTVWYLPAKPSKNVQTERRSTRKEKARKKSKILL